MTALIAVSKSSVYSYEVRKPKTNFAASSDLPPSDLHKPLLRVRAGPMVSRMANHSDVLDDMFAALSDPTRRAVVRRLGAGEASVGELAAESSMALPSFLKHIRALERSGLVHTSKSGRVRTCSLRSERLEVLEDWLSEQRQVWERRTDRLEALVTTPPKEKK